jgi:hypothetical protein
MALGMYLKRGLAMCNRVVVAESRLLISRAVWVTLIMEMVVKMLVGWNMDRIYEHQYSRRCDVVTGLMNLWVSSTFLY